MLKKLINCFIINETNEAIADCFDKTFENCNFEYIEADELKAINTALDELKSAKILQKWALDEISEYHKAVRKELKEREEDYF